MPFAVADTVIDAAGVPAVAVELIVVAVASTLIVADG
jgi:hypothetical protein